MTHDDVWKKTSCKNVGCLNVNARKSHGVKDLANGAGRRDVVVHVSHVDAEHIGAALAHVRGVDVREGTECRFFAQQNLNFTPQHFRVFWCHDFYNDDTGGGFWKELTCKFTCGTLGLFVAACFRNKPALGLILELACGDKIKT